MYHDFTEEKTEEDRSSFHAETSGRVGVQASGAWQPILYVYPVHTVSFTQCSLDIEKCDEAGLGPTYSAFVLILTIHLEANYGLRDNMGVSGPPLHQLAFLPT